MTRKRKHIPISEIAASALADKLTLVERAELVARKAPAREVLRLFTPDHIKLHCWGGEDKWFNLDLRRRGPELKAKDAADTSRAAKSVRIEGDWKEFVHYLHSGQKPPKRKSRWPSRPFPKRGSSAKVHKR